MIRVADDSDSVLALCFFQLSGHERRNDSHLSPGFCERERLAGPDRAAADDYGCDALTVEGDREE